MSNSFEASKDTVVALCSGNIEVPYHANGSVNFLVLKKRAWLALHPDRSGGDKEKFQTLQDLKLDEVNVAQQEAAKEAAQQEAAKEAAQQAAAKEAAQQAAAAEAAAAEAAAAEVAAAEVAAAAAEVAAAEVAATHLDATRQPSRKRRRDWDQEVEEVIESFAEVIESLDTFAEMLERFSGPHPNLKGNFSLQELMEETNVVSNEVCFPSAERMRKFFNSLGPGSSYETAELLERLKLSLQRYGGCTDARAKMWLHAEKNIKGPKLIYKIESKKVSFRFMLIVVLTVIEKLLPGQGKAFLKNKFFKSDTCRASAEAQLQLALDLGPEVCEMWVLQHRPNTYDWRGLKTALEDVQGAEWVTLKDLVQDGVSTQIKSEKQKELSVAKQIAKRMRGIDTELEFMFLHKGGVPKWDYFTKLVYMEQTCVLSEGVAQDHLNRVYHIMGFTGGFPAEKRAEIIKGLFDTKYLKN